MVTGLEILEGKSGGNWFTPDDIEKQTMTIVESIVMGVTQLREHTTGKKYKNEKGEEREQKYFCILCSDGKVEKDLHLTYTGIRQLFSLLPRQEDLKGYQFVVDAVKKQGKLDIRVIGKVDFAAQQQRLKSYEEKPKVVLPGTKTAYELFIEKLASPGIHDSRLLEVAMASTGNDQAWSTFMIDMLKNQGLIIQKPDGCWVKT